VLVRGRARVSVVDGPALLGPPGAIDARDPFPSLVAAWFGVATPRARWAVVVGREADAIAALDRAVADRELLVVRTGRADADALLADLAPVLGRLLDDMTASQRRIVRYLLVDGLRQADAAELLGISRASVSVALGRARLHEVELLLRAVRAAWTVGLAGDGLDTTRR